MRNYKLLRNNSKIPTFTLLNFIHMNEKLKKLLHIIAMCVALVAVLVFAVIHAVAALDSEYGTIMMIAYVLMFIWATCRVVVLIKDYKGIDR